MHGLWHHVDLGSNPGSAITSCITLDNVIYFSEPQLPPPSNGLILCTFWVSDDIMHMKPSALSLAGPFFLIGFPPHPTPNFYLLGMSSWMS